LVGVKFKGGCVNLDITNLNQEDEHLALDPVLEKKVQILVELRKYKLLGQEEEKEGARFIVADADGKKMLVWAIPAVETVGVRYVNQLAKDMKTKEIDRGIIVSNGRYTQSSQSAAHKNKIELLPAIFPSFNIFEHSLVPKHEVLTPEEKAAVLAQYRVEAYHLPRIRLSDPVIRVIGARSGDLIKITRKSATAGEYVTYRYVVDG
jgi:DNA-directed RNA polymerase subunit H (RpoH/RPB5)